MFSAGDPVCALRQLQQVWSPSSPSAVDLLAQRSWHICLQLPTSLTSLQLHFSSFLQEGLSDLSSGGNCLAQGQFQTQAKLRPPQKLIGRQQEASLFHLLSMQHIYLLYS